jgi:hypothetical protein
MITGQAPDGACQIALPCPLDSEGPHKSERRRGGFGRVMRLHVVSR